MTYQKAIQWEDLTTDKETFARELMQIHRNVLKFHYEENLQLEAKLIKKLLGILPEV
jgi:hypothetical protein